MTVNVKKMKPLEMVRFLNTTELGTAISAAMVYRHFSEAATASPRQRTPGA